MKKSSANILSISLRVSVLGGFALLLCVASCVGTSSDSGERAKSEPLRESAESAPSLSAANDPPDEDTGTIPRSSSPGPRPSSPGPAAAEEGGMRGSDAIPDAVRPGARPAVDWAREPGRTEHVVEAEPDAFSADASSTTPHMPTPPRAAAPLSKTKGTESTGDKTIVPVDGAISYGSASEAVGNGNEHRRPAKKTPRQRPPEENDGLQEVRTRKSKRMATTENMESPAEAPVEDDRLSTGRPVVEIALLATDVRIGDEVLALVRIRGARDVASVPFHLVFDPEILAWEAASEGPFLSRDGQPTAFMTASASAGGRLVVGASRLGQALGASGSGEICTIRFRALASGTTALLLDRAKVIDSFGQVIPAGFAPTSVVIR